MRIVAILGLLGIGLVMWFARQSPPTSLDIVRRATYSVPDKLDIPSMATTAEHAVANLIYEGLFKFAKDSSIQPSLVVDWKVSRDRLTYDFTLKNNVLFHDQTQMTSHHVKENLDRIIKGASGVSSGLFARIKSVVVPGKSRLRISLSVPFSPLLSFLASPAAKIHLAHDGPFPIGTGPYYPKMPVGSESKNKFKVLKLDRHESYHGPKPAMNKVEFVETNEDTARQLAEDGYVHDTLLIPTNRGKLKPESRAREVFGTSTSTWILSLNSSHKRLKLPTRKCLRKYFDSSLIVRKYLPDHTPAVGFIPRNLPGGHREITIDPDNSDCNKAIIPRDLTIEFDYPSVLADGLNICKDVAQTWKKELGVAVQCRGKSLDEILAAIKKGDAQISFFSQTLDLPDMEYYVNSFESNSDLNFSNLHSPQFDLLLHEARNEIEPTKRNEIFSRINQLLYDEVATINISHPLNVGYIHKCLTGIELGLGGVNAINYINVRPENDCASTEDFSLDD